MDARDVKQIVAKALGGVRQALRGMVQRVGGARQVILVQMEGLAGEPFNAVEQFQQPGLRSIALAGMQPIMVPLNGNSANGVIIAMSNGALYIADLQPGEIALFNENDGVANSIVLRNGKIQEITCDTLKIKALLGVEIDTPLVKMTHALEVAENSKTATITVTSAAANASQMAGGLQATGDITANGKSLDSHTHLVTAIGTQTAPPT